jgi:hypothetical protein
VFLTDLKTQLWVVAKTQGLTVCLVYVPPYLLGSTENLAMNLGSTENLAMPNRQTSRQTLGFTTSDWNRQVVLCRWTLYPATCILREFVSRIDQAYRYSGCERSFRVIVCCCVLRAVSIWGTRRHELVKVFHGKEISTGPCNKTAHLTGCRATRQSTVAGALLTSNGITCMGMRRNFCPVLAASLQQYLSFLN